MFLSGGLILRCQVGTSGGAQPSQGDSKTGVHIPAEHAEHSDKASGGDTAEETAYRLANTLHDLYLRMTKADRFIGSAGFL
jgi:hypothetical protein